MPKPLAMHSNYALWEVADWRTALASPRLTSPIRAVNLRGITMRGTLQFVPVSRERLLLFSFLDKPALDVKLNIRGRFIGQQSVPQFDFLRAAIVAAIQKDFVEPNRGVVPLEYAPVMVRSYNAEI